MSIFNAYIVFILKTADDQYITGVTNDIDTVISRTTEAHLVYQQHFDQEESATAFEQQLRDWDSKRKEALISGDESASG